ncbi:nmrA-like family domain-containing protein 1 [Physella acuta]|uniref:nmrA-like family domain-containing protein 1 n=1 Tax=Physella acuta TaxID=109671 RepID=UPI0027DBFCC1|nr:nmrA-like family domain-containing protein 1 [Physella acuta]
MSKPLVVVFGATGKQGGSVARALARSGEFSVRGVTRDESGARVQELREAGVELVTFDPTESKGLERILNNAFACFVNTYTDFDDVNCLDTEIAHGCLIADYCKSANVQHVIFSSQLHSNKICSLMARHLVAKAEVEQYMRDIDLPLTCLIMPVYYEDILDIFKPQTADGKTYDIQIPMGTTPLDMMSVEDVGPIVLTVLRHRNQYLSKTVSVCGDKITVREMAQVLGKYLKPRLFKDKQITAYDFQTKRSGDLKGSADWANMFQFFQRVDQKYNLSVTKQMSPEVRTFDTWVQQNQARINTCL